MLLAYRPDDGRVIWNSGFNTNYPMGPPDFVAADAAGADKLLYRVNDASTEAKRIDAGEGAVVKSGRLIFDGGTTPTPPPAPPELSMAEVLAMIEKLQTQSVALQEQSDLLTTMVLGGSL